MEIVHCDVCVIGAGSAGLSVAAGAAQLGAKTILFERGAMGGDCLNYGCVPSKALLAAAGRAQAIRDAHTFGIEAGEAKVDFAKVMAHVQDVIAQIAPHDSVERFEGFGVRVIKADAKFTGPRQVSSGDVCVNAKRIVIAAGSEAAVPPIPGLDETPFLTNETIFSLTEQPRHLLIVGGGPIGMEMAQAFVRLGSAVTVLEAATILPKDEPGMVDSLRQILKAEGVTIRENAKVTRISRAGDAVAISLDGEAAPITGSHVLIAAGRKPRLEGLGLDTANIATNKKGVVVDARLRTSTKHVYAIGDIAGGPQFTHVAGYHGGLFIRNALFRLPAKVDYRTLPWVTYTEPELAHIGMTEADARRQYGDDIQIIAQDIAKNDRAQAQRETAGRIRIITRRGKQILGVSILGANAGELISLWSLAMTKKMKPSVLLGLMLPYPTVGEISKTAISNYFAPKLFSKWPRLVVRLLLRLG